MARSQLDEFLAPARKYRSGLDEERVDSFSHHGGKDAIKFLLSARVEDANLHSDRVRGRSCRALRFGPAASPNKEANVGDFWYQFMEQSKPSRFPINSLN